MQDVSRDIENKKRWSKVISEVLKSHRKRLKVSVYAIAPQGDIVKNTWYDVESCKCKDPAFSTIWKMAEALDIPPEKLVAEIRQKLGDDFSLSGLN